MHPRDISREVDGCVASESLKSTKRRSRHTEDALDESFEVFEDVVLIVHVFLVRSNYHISLIYQ